MKICFLDANELSYTSRDINSKNLRGAENILINLSHELIKLNQEITVYNNCTESGIINKINWDNIKNIKKNNKFDIAITNNDIRLLNKINAIGTSVIKPGVNNKAKQTILEYNRNLL